VRRCPLLAGLVAGALALGLAMGPVAAQTKPDPAPRPGARPPAKPAPAPRSSATEKLAKTSADLAKATREYRASLDRLLAVYESDLSRATELIEVKWALFAKGQATRQEIEELELARLVAQENLEETRQWIDEANRLQLEASLSDRLNRLPALPPGGYESTEAFVRFNGVVKFELTDAPRIQRFFAERFGRPLPVSAYGQTAVHDRFGFDHRNALDVAVHPDSVEGQTLADYLRRAGISFVAFRQAIRGAATGAHFHIGEPSRRLMIIRR
jgi:hypothetical protein